MHFLDLWATRTSPTTSQRKTLKRRSTLSRRLIWRQEIFPPRSATTSSVALSTSSSTKTPSALRTISSTTVQTSLSSLPTHCFLSRVMAFDGQNSNNIHIRVCTLLACEFDSEDSCGARVNTTTRFTKITVKGNLQKEEGTFYMPLTLNYNLKTIAQTVYCDTNNATNGTFVQMTTTAAQNNVLVFGLLGRSSAGHLYAVFFLVVLGVVKCFLF
jgi:hypothetical protein